MTTQNFIERIAQETCALICERTCSSMCSDDLISNAIQSFARKVVEEIREEDSVRHKHNPLTVEEVVGIVLSLSGVEDPLRGLSGEDNQP